MCSVFLLKPYLYELLPIVMQHHWKEVVTLRTLWVNIFISPGFACVALPRIVLRPVHSSHGALVCSQLEFFCLFFEVSLQTHDKNLFRIAASVIEL